MDKNIENTEKLDLLKKEGLTDYALENPSGLNKSINLIYGLIEFAKERYKTDNLDKINRGDIFLPSPALKRLYGMTVDDIKKRFEYKETTKEKEQEYIILAKDFENIQNIEIDDSIQASEFLNKTVSKQNEISSDELKKYGKAFTEVYTILNYLENESFFRLPLNVITAIEGKQDKEYKFYINENIPFSEQKLMKETKAILHNLFRDYFANRREKQDILSNQLEQMLELEDISKEIYNAEVLADKDKNN